VARRLHGLAVPGRQDCPRVGLLGCAALDAAARRHSRPTREEL